MYTVASVSALLAFSLACGRESSAPVAPSAVSSTASNASASDGSTLKVGAPTLVSPINDQKLDETATTLVASGASVKYTSGGALLYDFELYDDANVKVKTEVVAATAWPFNGLAFNKRYTWRVRATVDNAYGPWSTFGSFVTPDNTGYLKGNEMFDPLTNGQTVARAVNDVTFILGQGVRLNGQESYVEWQLPATLTDGEFSVIITNIRNSNEQWKTKVMSMLQGDGVNVTDNAYRFTADRRNRDSSGAVRWTLRSRGTDAGEPNCGSQSWDPTHNYLWTYRWSGGGSNLTVRDGGRDGRVLNSCGTTYRAPYAPNPHLIRLGSVGGRGGSETLPQAVFRNVWVSPNARPFFPTDIP